MKLRKVKKNGKPRWLVDLGILNGKRERRFFKTKPQAKAFFDARKIELQNSGAEALTLSHEDRLSLIAAKKKLQPTGKTIMEAVDFFLSHGTPQTPKPIADAVLECLEAKTKSGKRKRYLQSLKSSLTSFAVSHPGKLCSDISAPAISQWLDGNGWAIATRRGYLIDLRTLFSFALKRGYCQSNPALIIERPNPEPQSPAIYTVQQLKHFLGILLKHDPAIAGHVAPRLFGGSRRSESEQLKKENLLSDYIDVKAHSAKTRERRLLPLNGTLRSWMNLATEIPIKNRNRRILRIRKLAELDGKPFPWPHNALRHSFCSYALPIFGARETAAAAGHSETILFQRYRELVTKEEAEKFWQLTPDQLRTDKPNRRGRNRAAKPRQ